MLTDGRLGVPPTKSLSEHVNRVQLTSELDSLQEFVELDLAHVITLAECGALSRGVAAKLLTALLRVEGPNPEVRLAVDDTRGSMLLQIEAYLIAECGPDGGMLQLARSRIDQSAAAMRLLARRHTDAVIAALLTFGEAQLKAAARYDLQPIPGYTHFQHAQPTTLGHYLNAHYWVTSRNIERLEEALARIDLSALGGAAMVGTDWPLDRERTAALLGHRGLVFNARDAGAFALDINAEVAGELALTLGGLGRLAGDLLLWSSSELQYVKLYAGLCGTSSMMPQKRNPYALERVRALSGEAIGWSASQLGVVKLATSTDGDIVFARNRIPEMCESVVGAIELMTDTIETLEIDSEAMRRSAGSGWSTVSSLADELVRHARCSFRVAHDIVARLVRLSEEQGRTAEQLESKDLKAAVVDAGLDLDVDGIDIRSVLDVDRFIGTRTSFGGAAKAERARLAALALADLQQHRGKFAETQDRVSAAHHELLTTAREMASR